MSQLLLRRTDVIQRLRTNGLTARQARKAIESGALPKATHRLHSQARWWPADVAKFDCVAFLASLNHDGAGEQGTHPNSRADARSSSLPS